MEINRSDLSSSATADFYFIRYKMRRIGGAGVKLPREKPLTHKQREANLREFADDARRTIDELVAGRGPAHMREAIERIEAELSAPMALAA